MNLLLINLIKELDDDEDRVCDDFDEYEKMHLEFK